MVRIRDLLMVMAAALLTVARLVPAATAGEAAVRQTPTPPCKPTHIPAEVTAVPLEELDPLPADVNPLTGRPVGDAALLERRPLLVKISNYPALVRPQHAINRADHVWEHIVEGGGTRFTAVYLTEDLPQIGSVRSARLIDLHLVPIYRGLLAYSGGSLGVLERLRRQPWFGDRTFSPEEEDQCPLFCRYPEEGLDFWHTMFASARAIREEAAALGVEERVDLRGLTFSEELPSGGTPATKISLGYPGTNCFWRYSPAADKHYRWTEGEPHLDDVGDVQVAYTNVVLIYADHVEDTGVLEDEIGAGHYAVDIQLQGEGPAVIFRSGRRYEGRWVRPNPEGMIRLVDEGGNDIPLAPGTTWFHVLPRDHTDLTV
jgi:hypothetical protein